MKGPQVYVARTDRLREVPYDERIRMVDHRDFFSSASGRLVFVQRAAAGRLPRAHAVRQEVNVLYREDVAKDLTYLAREGTGRPVD